MANYQNLTQEDAVRLREELNELLDRQFNHRDHTILDRKWKLIRADQFASILLQIIDMEIERKINGLVV